MQVNSDVRDILLDEKFLSFLCRYCDQTTDVYRKIIKEFLSKPVPVVLVQRERGKLASLVWALSSDSAISLTSNLGAEERSVNRISPEIRQKFTEVLKRCNSELTDTKQFPKTFEISRESFVLLMYQLLSAYSLGAYYTTTFLSDVAGKSKGVPELLSAPRYTFAYKFSELCLRVAIYLLALVDFSSTMQIDADARTFAIASFGVALTCRDLNLNCSKKPD
jgi:hypothetical protein